MQFPQARILVFCRAPVVGEVKTRLAVSIGDAEAARCHQALATHCLQTVAASPLAPVQLWCTPDTEHAYFYQQKKAFYLSLHQQSGEDLGEKMGHAFDVALQDAEYALVIGTDCPAINDEYLFNALSALRDGAPAVIGPAEDGGYVLLGLRKNNNKLFEDMPWGSDRVFEKTCHRLGPEHQVLPMLWDVDVVDDLRRLKRDAPSLGLSHGLSHELKNYLLPIS